MSETYISVECPEHGRLCFDAHCSVRESLESQFLLTVPEPEYSEMKERIAELTRICGEHSRTLSRLSHWADTYGAALKPTAGSADSFGDGMRAAKEQVKNMLTVKP